MVQVQSSSTDGIKYPPPTISSKDNLHDFLKEEKKRYSTITTNIKTKIIYLLCSNPNSAQYLLWRYVKTLRYVEYYLNNSIYRTHGMRAIIMTIAYVWKVYQLRQLAYKTGIQIPPNVFDKGLQIYHWGSIVVNGDAKVGKNAKIYPGVVIGAHKGACPVIGNDCFIGAGAKITGGITIGDNVTIAPNAVVTKSFPSNTIIGGIPAKIIKYKND